jgi:hypothetical protein
MLDLVRQLEGREPVLHREPYLPKGEVWWLTTLLPNVFVAPDVYELFSEQYFKAVEAAKASA